MVIKKWIKETTTSHTGDNNVGNETLEMKKHQESQNLLLK